MMLYLCDSYLSEYTFVSYLYKYIIVYKFILQKLSENNKSLQPSLKL